MPEIPALKPKVCIVIVSYNSSTVLDIAADSLIRAKTQVPFDVILIDNGSKVGEKLESKRIYDKLIQACIDAEFIDSGQNLGFSGGNNIGYQHFLKDPLYSHLCLLNTDVVVTDFWLERLIEHQVDAIGPVTNTAGNEQTVPTSYVANRYVDCFDPANKFAEERYQLFRSKNFKSDVLVFYCVLFSRRLVTDIGLLDTQFFPGCFEDDDYCVRILRKNFQMYVARDVFIHHWGGASFAQLPLSRIKDILTNKKRFEKKYSTDWAERTGKLAVSLEQDLISLPAYANFNENEKNIIHSHIESLSSLLNRYSRNDEKYNASGLREHFFFWAEKKVEDMRRWLPRPFFVLTKFILFSIGDPNAKKLMNEKIRKKIAGKTDE